MESIGNPWLWAGFITFVLAMLALDLGVFNRKAHVVGMKEAAVWSGVWVSLALVFNAGLFWKYGSQVGVEFLSAYVVEKSLSVDNIFVFVVIFSSLAVPAIYQHRVLFWGILSALVLRAAMIFGGVALLNRFHWLMYVFGAFLLFTGAKMLYDWLKSSEEAEGEGAMMRWARKAIGATEHYDGQRFFTVQNGKRVATPLLLALVVVELSDVMFALDSIPAVFAVTRDPFIVFTSNIFAILGLRSLFFLVAGMMDKFAYLKVGLSGILAFVGVKMLIIDVVKVPPAISLGVIGAMLAAAMLVSLRRAPKLAPAPVPVPAQVTAKREEVP